MIIAGIDYSLTSPAICVHYGEDEWRFSSCEFFYFSYKEKNCVRKHPFHGTMYPEFTSDAQRYDNLSKWSLGIIEQKAVEKCFIEGYSFNSVGRVFQIAENTGLLKYNLWKSGTAFDVFPPTMIKKHATGKGNSPKNLMYEAFVNETGVDIRSKLDIMNPNAWNPISDIVDAYYISKLGFMKEKTNDCPS